jgi:hypothetical protein
MSEDNVVELVQEAQSKGKFKLTDAIKGRAFPEAFVDVYIDAGSAYEFGQIQEDVKSVDPNSEEHEKMVARMEELAEAIKQSKLTFHMRGVGQGLVEKATRLANKKYPRAEKGEEESEWVAYYLSMLVADNIVKVVDFEGNVDDSKFSVDDVLELRGIMPVDSWEVLIDTMQKLTLASGYFEAVTDSGFLPKS